MALNKPYQSKFLEGLAEMSGCWQTNTDQRKMLRSKEKEQSNLIVEEVVKVLEETFLNPFSDDLDKNQLYNIVSCKTVSIEIKDSLITIDEQPMSLALSCLDGTIRKTCKSKLYEAAMYDLWIAEQNKLPGKSVMNTYVLDLIRCKNNAERLRHNLRFSMENI